ncbi:T9SS type A sorting domain-containing protein [Hymenobacter sp. ASUV-10]|uniref:receptor protein-tyrosine kinase n=1 Tax=Hymenobacter aranciens TaxID=3063996 RepID=A0ABT9BH94_9BACT|nr:T9SS type A sorting domain-containing protein [Hymenobacter sp. ASUV-10]MDO7877627.1 T9SS type A sorting domain-containing protein [Hymenobacter sp. ASUV-10]
MTTFFASLTGAARPVLAALALVLAASAAQAQMATSYAYTGGVQTYTVPAGITAVQVTATGASGGTHNTFVAGHLNGAVVRATLTVVPGEVLTVVGGQGGNGSFTLFNGAGGYNGGTGRNSGGGGGATDVRRASSAGSTGDYLPSRNALVVAGGSGGAGFDNPTLYNALGGGGGVPNGGDGQGRGTPGLGATQTAAGGGGVSGSGATGGTGNNGGARCAGGGGGYYGGGGAATSTGGSGGGGGSSWVMPTGSRDISYSLAPAIGNGSVSITPVATTYAYVAPNGGTQTYTVPAGVTAVQITATGASGGTYSGTAYSSGAQVQATLAVTPGEVLTVVVGSQGSSGTRVAGGYNGGGIGGGGGGGASDVRRASGNGSTGDYLTSRNALVVADGGGGGDISPPATGGNGGTPTGGAGTPLSSFYVNAVGRGATQTAPGSGGGCCNTTGSAGSNGIGGAGSATSGGGGGGGYYGGGGGGGYYGGGGGAGPSGGGGGSSWATAAATGVSYSVAPATGAGSVSILPLTTAYAYTGGLQTYLVPAGVTAVRVVATGGGGGIYNTVTTPAKGAVVQATLLVTPGEVLTLAVGGRGTDIAHSSGSSGVSVAGGYNGGGNGAGSGAGGGATDVRRAASVGSTGDYLPSRNALLVAGGGGGGHINSSMQGGDGGAPLGGNGRGFGTFGLGATHTAPGGGGVPGSGPIGASGTGDHNGGGGGGYYGGGGGGGGSSNGGGGGSSWVMPTSSTGISYSLASASTNGDVSITPVPLADLVVSTAGQPVPAGLYNSLTVLSGGVGTLAGPVSVVGSTTVASGGTLHDGCEALSGPGSFTLAAGGTLGICHKFGISATGSTGAIQVTGPRSFSPDASYLYTDGAQQTGSGLPATVRVLGLANGFNLALTNSVTATAAATFSRGVLLTGANTLTLGPTATLAEDEDGYVTGTVQTTRLLATAGATEAFGGLGLTLTPSGVTLPGSTLVIRTTGTARTGAGSSRSVLRYFDIQPTVTTGLNVALTLTVPDNELNNISESRLRLFKSEDAGANWQLQPAATFATTNASGTQPRSYTASLAGVRSFSLWTLGNARDPLPVELTTFTATAAGPAAVRLAWATASEKNSARFEVERSTTGEAFEPIGGVQAQGTKASPTAYAFPDKQPLAGRSYYRLRQVDLDGTASYSPVRAVTLGGPAHASFTAYPNPAHDAVTATGLPANAAVEVFDALGRAVARATADAAGTARLALPAGLAAGVYVVRSGAQARRLTVE